MQRTATEPQRGSSGEVLPRPATERSQRAGGNGGHRTCTLVWAFLTSVSTTPAADFCCRISVNYFTLSLEFETCNRSPTISSTAFDTRPPDLPPAFLMDTDFAIICPLVQRRRPQIRFLSIGPYLCFALPSDPTSRGRPCASLPFTSIRLGRDFHPLAAEHAWRTKKTAGNFARQPFKERVQVIYGLRMRQ